MEYEESNWVLIPKLHLGLDPNKGHSTVHKNTKFLDQNVTVDTSRFGEVSKRGIPRPVSC